jgi:hypothetical protein
MSLLAQSSACIALCVCNVPQDEQHDDGESAADVRDGVLAQVSRQRDRIGEASRKAAACAAVPLRPGMISLIWHDEDALFVRWTSPSVREGQVISLDSFARVIAIVSFIVPKMDFSSARVLVADTGAVMLRVKGPERPPMTDWCILLRWWHQAHHFPGPLTGDHHCVWCDVWHSIRGEACCLVGADRRRFACTSCSLVWCEACAKAYCKGGFNAEMVCPPCQAMGALSL